VSLSHVRTYSNDPKPPANPLAAKDRADQKDMSDWTRKGPLPDLPGAGRRVSERGGFGDRSAGGGGGFGGDRAGGFERGRNFEPAGSDAGSERGERRRPPPFEGDGKTRDFSNWERKGPLSPVSGATPPSRDGGRTRTYDGPREQRQSPAAGWGEGRAGAPAEGGSQDGSRPPRREFQDRPQHDRQPTAPELDNQWRTKMRPDAVAKSPTSTPDASTPSSPAPQPAAPAGRPRLNLAKRTVSEAVPAPITSASESKSNPFGAARPIDTATREKEIEEKREHAIREKKEADDKAREEKRAKDTADRSARASVPPTPTTEAHRDNDSEEKPAASYEILQRGEDDAGNEEDATAVDASANGEIVEDKAVKPQEVVRDPPKAEGAGAWRRKGAPAAEPTESTTETMEDDGWSTVTKPKATKSTRGGPPARGGRGGPPARAIAS
jgi:translation initiation factor 4B